MQQALEKTGSIIKLRRIRYRRSLETLIEKSFIPKIVADAFRYSIEFN
jgi:hypothetical protein